MKQKPKAAFLRWTKAVNKIRAYYGKQPLGGEARRKTSLNQTLIFVSTNRPPRYGSKEAEAEGYIEYCAGAPSRAVFIRAEICGI